MKSKVIFESWFFISQRSILNALPLLNGVGHVGLISN